MGCEKIAQIVVSQPFLSKYTNNFWNCRKRRIAQAKICPIRSPCSKDTSGQVEKTLSQNLKSCYQSAVNNGDCALWRNERWRWKKNQINRNKNETSIPPNRSALKIMQSLHSFQFSRLKINKKVCHSSIANSRLLCNSRAQLCSQRERERERKGSSWETRLQPFVNDNSALRLDPPFFVLV
jgi:hypothetical protein